MDIYTSCRKQTIFQLSLAVIFTGRCIAVGLTRGQKFIPILIIKCLLSPNSCSKLIFSDHKYDYIFAMYYVELNYINLNFNFMDLVLLLEK
jgi:hypothetical protein